MSELIVLGFDQTDEAEAVLGKLRQLEKEYLIDLDDAVTAVRDEKGSVRLKQSFDPLSVGAANGGIMGAAWGALVGLLFLNPLAGFVIGGVVGAGSGAIAGSAEDYGIDDAFIKSLAETIPNNSSALFLLIRNVQPEKVLEAFKGEGARVLKTSLSPDQEVRLQNALGVSLSTSTAVGAGAV